ncbi:MAG: HAD family hydrolase [Clostridia bacterium]|nr:HAD family hydrolase [Clostridia bacterium]
MIQACLFDLDGTLVNTLEDISSAMNYALRQFGLAEYSQDEYRYLVGNGARKLAERAVRMRQDLVEDVLRCYQHRYETHNLVRSRPYEGIPEMLSDMKRRGWKLAVLSNKPDQDTKHVISHYFGDDIFDHVQGQKAGIPVKPDPTAALQIAQALEVSPGDMLYFGDTSVDMTCAVRSGMHPVGVLWGFRELEELKKSGAEWILKTPKHWAQVTDPGAHALF